MAKKNWTKDDPVLIATVDEFRANNMNVSATARVLKMPRKTLFDRLQAAHKFGILADEEMRDPNTPSRDAYLSAKTRKLAAYQKKASTGAWDKPVLVNLPAGPFRLKVFGDPHMDADAFDINLWEKHWFEMDAAGGVYGVCIGDWFNNWLRALAHLWKHEGDPSDAWTLFEHYMSERGDALIAACSGNHDDWTHGPADPIDVIMRRYGVIYRKGAVRLLVQAGSDRLTVALRHKWRGHSMYSPAHALRRAAGEGWADTIMVGGHTHQDEDRQHVQPRSGFISHLFQVSAFKRFDEYADVHGFRPHATSPVRDLVVDPRRADNDPDRVKVFHDSAAAAGYLEWLKSAR